MSIEGPLWYLSFADPTLPKGSHFQGACIVGPAHHIGTALRIAHASGCAARGQVLGCQVPDHLFPNVKESETFRLLDRAEAESLHFDERGEADRG